MGYDSVKDTKKHIAKVRQYVYDCADTLYERGTLHDWDKIEDPVEKKLFDTYTPKLANCTYGSDEYKEFLKELKPALDRHYKNNSHHPEHFKNGMRDMNLVDMIELICDWKASSERHEDGDIYKSIEINQERFGYSDDVKALLKNTADFLNRSDRMETEDD